MKSTLNIVDQLAQININKATGPGDIGAKLIKELRHEIAIYIIFKRSLDELVFPSPWKRANVTPIYKQEAHGLGVS
jgi:hypothetical protein